MYSPITVSKLNDIAHRHKDIIQRAIVETLRQPRYVNTGAGAASVTVDVTDGDANKSPVITIEFDDHIKFLDKRKLQWTELPNMKKLLEWAATKESDPTKAKKLAFATAWDKKRHDTWKAKPWRKKSLSTVLKELNILVIAAFDRAIDEDLQEGIAG
jgi:hypothetical protein